LLAVTSDRQIARSPGSLAGAAAGAGAVRGGPV